MKRRLHARPAIGPNLRPPALLAFLCGGATALAGSSPTEWTGNGTNDNWSNDDNWSPMTAPLTGDIDIRSTDVLLDVSPFLADAIIGDPMLPANTGGVNILGAGQISVGGDLLATNVTLGGPGITLRANGTGQIRGQTQVGSGRVEINGAITSLDNSFTLGSAGTVGIAGTLTALGGLPFSGDGTVTCSGSITGDFTTAAGVTFRATDATIAPSLGGISLAGPVEFTGLTLNTDSALGGLSLTGGGTIASSRFELATTIPEVIFRNTTYTFSGTSTAASQAENAKPVRVGSGAVLDGTATLATEGTGSWALGPFVLVAGQIASEGTLRLDSPGISGTLTIEGGEATVTAGSGATVTGSLINRATLIQTGSVTINGIAINEPMGAWGNTGGTLQAGLAGLFRNRGDFVASPTGQAMVAGNFEQTASGETRVTSGVLVIRGSLMIAGDCSALPLSPGGAELRLGTAPGDSITLDDTSLFTTGLGQISLNDGAIRVQGTLRTDGTGSPAGGVRLTGGALHSSPAASIDASDSNPFVIDCDLNEGAVLSVATLTNNGPMTWRRGAFLSTPGAPAFVNSGIGTIRVEGGFARRIGGPKPIVADSVQQDLPNDLSGAIVNEGSITVGPFAGTAWTHRNDGLLINTGTITLEGDSIIEVVDLSPIPQASLTNSGLLSKAGGTGSAFINVRLNNTGVVESQSGRLAIRDALQVDENTQTLSGGTWRSVAGGRIEFLQLAGLSVNDGTLALSGPGSEIVGLADIERNNGTLTLEGGASLTTDAFVNSGAVDIPEGLLESLTFDLDDADAVLTIGPNGAIVVTGDLTNGSPGVVDSEIRSTDDGQDRRAGTQSRGDAPDIATISASTLHNHAVIAPGGTNATGPLAINADLVCHETSTIAIDLFGPSDADTLTVSGAATLAGTIQLTTDPGYQPTLGDSITILTASSLTGTATVDEADPAPGLRWRAETTPTELRLTAACPGDLAPPFGVLDLADIGAFIDGFLNQQPIADLTNDGVFDLADIGAFIADFQGGCD